MKVPLYYRKKIMNRKDIMNLKGEALKLLVVKVFPAALCRLNHGDRSKLSVGELASVLPFEINCRNSSL